MNEVTITLYFAITLSIATFHFLIEDVAMTIISNVYDKKYTNRLSHGLITALLIVFTSTIWTYFYYVTH